MRKLSTLLLFLLCGCTESLYLTTAQPLEDDQYVFIAPYFAEVNTKLVVAINPGTPVKEGTPAGPPSVTISVLPTPVSRAYLYLSKNALFTNAANVTIGSDGLLSSSDSSSSQQVTAILSELAQTAASFLGAPVLSLLPEEPAPAPREDDRKICAEGIKNLVFIENASAPYYRVFNDIKPTSGEYVVYSGPKSKIALTLYIEIPPGLTTERAQVGKTHAGLLAYYPVPATGTLICKPGNGTRIRLTPPIILNLYLDSHFIDPKRDFLTSPQDTYTFSGGFITGHKFANQSPVKTVVDTVTAPIRALMPSVTVTTQTQVQTGGGKPDQTTTQTTRQAAPPKVP